MGAYCAETRPPGELRGRTLRAACPSRMLAGGSSQALCPLPSTTLFRSSNQFILKDISPRCSLEGLMLRLKLQYLGHLMQRVDSLEKTLPLSSLKGVQPPLPFGERTRDCSPGLQCSCLENPRDGGAWWAAIYGVALGP